MRDLLSGLLLAALVGALVFVAINAFGGYREEVLCYHGCKTHGYIRSDIIHTGECVCVEAVGLTDLEKK